MDRKSENNSIYRNILTAFLILIMHVLLVGGIGMLIFFISGIINHTVWVIVGIACASAGGYWIYKRMRSDVRELKNIVGDSLKGRDIEISFLGGAATFKVNDKRGEKRTDSIPMERPRQLTGAGPEDVKTLSELAHLYEKKLITLDEYNRVKRKILK